VNDILSLAASHGGKASQPIDLLAALTFLAIIPFVLVMTTSFVRIVVVLSLIRQALGTPSLPPNTVLTGIALILTFVVMSPTVSAISHDAIGPYLSGKLDQRSVVDRGERPLREFMLRQTRRSDLEMFARLHHQDAGAIDRLPFEVITPAFAVGELRAAFSIGFALYLPFLAIDLAVASILMGLGMMMLSPTVVSLPCKILLFVMVDGWAVVLGGVASSFR
jgi:flagellar biosynthesis protein FliP